MLFYVIFIKGNERIDEMSRCDHHIFDDDGNGEMLMKMIMTTKEAFELKYKRGKTMFAEETVSFGQKLKCLTPSICH